MGAGQYGIFERGKPRGSALGSKVKPKGGVSKKKLNNGNGIMGSIIETGKLFI